MLTNRQAKRTQALLKKQVKETRQQLKAIRNKSYDQKFFENEGLSWILDNDYLISEWIERSLTYLRENQNNFTKLYNNRGYHNLLEYWRKVQKLHKKDVSSAKRFKNALLEIFANNDTYFMESIEFVEITNIFITIKLGSLIKKLNDKIDSDDKIIALLDQFDITFSSKLTHEISKAEKWFKNKTKNLDSSYRIRLWYQIQNRGFILKKPGGSNQEYIRESFRLDTKIGQLITTNKSLQAINWHRVITEATTASKVFDAVKSYQNLYQHSKITCLRRLSDISSEDKVNEIVIARMIIDYRNSFGGCVTDYLYGDKQDLIRKKPLKHFNSFLSVLTIQAILGLVIGTIAISLSAPAALGILLFLLGTTQTKFLAEAITKLFRTVPFPLIQYDYSEALPTNARTLYVTPSFFRDSTNLQHLVDELELQYLANRQENIFFGLALDFIDNPHTASISEEEVELVAIVDGLIKNLNQKYPHFEPRFYCWYRERRQNQAEEAYIGWERKRGKLEELNNMLRGEETSYINPLFIPNIEYVVTVDEDMRSDINMVAKLVGALHHPFNHPTVSHGKVTSGYGIAQPRLHESLQSSHKNFYSKIVSGQSGHSYYDNSFANDQSLDLYASGMFFGKGAYHLDTVKQVLGGMFVENKILSHDHLEGQLVRVLNVNNTRLIEEFPGNYLSVRARNHRWARGDIQSLFFSLFSNRYRFINKAQMIGNVLRVTGPMLALAAIITSLSLGSLPLATLTLIVIFIKQIVTVIKSLVNISSTSNPIFWGYQQFRTLKKILSEVLNYVITLLDQAVNITDAISRALYRLLISKKKLLQWRTAYSANADNYSGLINFTISLRVNEVLALIIIASGWYSGNILLISIGAVFALAPLWLSGIHQAAKMQIKNQVYYFDLIEKHFEYFNSTLETHKLVPDYVQTNLPTPQVASATSPTNIGMSLVALVCAHRIQTINSERFLYLINKIITNIQELPLWHGHLYNWIDISSGQPDGDYISSVDSANFTMCLIIAKQYVEQQSFLGGEILINFAKDYLQNYDLNVFFDPDRELFRVGTSSRLDNQPSLADDPLLTGEEEVFHYYDILASEANSISYLGIALGQVKPDHWYRLSRRLLNTWTYKTALASWSGSLFEYLTSQLWLKAPNQSLLHVAAKRATENQSSYRCPDQKVWGIGESATSVIGADGRYQYTMMGSPELGLRRQKSTKVFSPYNSVLAIRESEALVNKNLKRFEMAGTLTPTGFYDAIDCETNMTPVKIQYAHHQGFIVAALTNYLFPHFLPNLLNSYPPIKAAGILLEETYPENTRASITLKPRTEDEQVSRYYALEKHGYYGNNAAHIIGGRDFTSQLLPSGRTNWFHQGYHLNRPTQINDEGRYGFQVEVTMDNQALVWDDYHQSHSNNAITKTLSDEIIDAKETITLANNKEIREITVTNRSKQSLTLSFDSEFEPLLKKNYELVNNPRFSDFAIRAHLIDPTTFAFTRLDQPRIAIVQQVVCSLDTALISLVTDKEKKSFVNAGPYPVGQTSTKVSLASGESLTITWQTIAGQSVADCLTSLNHHSTKVLANTKLSEFQKYSFLAVAKNLWYPQTLDYNHDQSKLIKVFWDYKLDARFPVISVLLSKESSLSDLTDLFEGVKFLANKHYYLSIVVVSTKDNSYYNEIDYLIQQHIDMYQKVIFQSCLTLVKARDWDDKESSLGKLRAISGLMIDLDHTILEKEIFNQEPPTNQSLSPHYYHKQTTQQPEYQFIADGQLFQYCLEKETTPSKPWVTILANSTFGTLIHHSGKSYSWYKNSSEQQITSKDHDPHRFKAGEWLTIKINNEDEEVITDNNQSRVNVTTSSDRINFQTKVHDHTCQTEVTVAQTEPVKLTSVSITNTTGEASKIELSAYLDMVLGSSMHTNLLAFTSTSDSKTTYVRSLSHADFTTPVLLTWLGASVESPASLEFTTVTYLHRVKKTVTTTLAPQQTFTIIFCVSVGKKLTDKEVLKLATPVDNLVRIKSADQSTDIMFNNWLLPQILHSRYHGRLGFFQPSGAYGFRDQLQDINSLLFHNPELAREHIIRAAEWTCDTGNSFNWWLPDSGFSLIKRFTDHPIWLLLAITKYLDVTGDISILEVETSFKLSPSLDFGNNGEWAGIPENDATLRTIASTIEKIVIWIASNRGTRKLILQGQSDWNDGFSETGSKGRAESIWTTQFFLHCLRRLEDNADVQGVSYSSLISELELALSKHGTVNGEQVRLYTDEDVALGISQSPAMQDNLLSSAWSALSATEITPLIKKLILATYNNLVTDQNALLFAPAIDEDYEPRIGYIQNYPAGTRENSAQYNHATLWFAQALFTIGEPDKAMTVIDLINPIKLTKARGNEYGGEPYAVAADIFAPPSPYAGSSGWTWYTGSAGVLYLTILEFLYGITFREGNLIKVSPCFPSDYHQAQLQLQYQQKNITLEFRRDAALPTHSAVIISQADPSVINIDTVTNHQIIEVLFN